VGADSVGTHLPRPRRSSGPIQVPGLSSPMPVTVSPVAVPMSTEREVEPRSIRVVTGSVAIVVPPIRPAAMVMTAVPPAAPIAIVNRFCRVTGAYPNSFEAGYGSRRDGSSEHAKCERGRRQSERLDEHALSFLSLARRDPSASRTCWTTLSSQVQARAAKKNNPDLSSDES
jgi:hypothetical protein